MTDHNITPNFGSTTPVAKKKPWYKKPLTWIITAAVLLALIIGNGIASEQGEDFEGSVSKRTSQESLKDKAEEPAEEPEPEPTEEPVEAPEPAAKEGTLANPWPTGYTFTISDKTAGVNLYSASVALIDNDAQAALLSANQFNDLAPEGQRYVLVQATVTGLNADKPVSPGMEAFSWNLADANGTLYRQSFVVTPGEDLSGAPELYEGQSFTGQIAFLVPADANPLYFSAYGGYIAL